MFQFVKLLFQVCKSVLNITYNFIPFAELLICTRQLELNVVCLFVFSFRLFVRRLCIISAELAICYSAMDWHQNEQNRTALQQYVILQCLTERLVQLTVLRHNVRGN
jgi:hypothetical protein